MNANQTTTIIALLCLGSAVHGFAQQNNDELKQRVLQQAQSMGADDYAFTRTARTKAATGGRTEQKVNVEKFDPTKPAGARWTLVSVDGAPPSDDALKRFRKESAKRRVPGYHRLAVYFGSPATATTDPRGRPLFRFTALPKGTIEIMGTDVSQNATVEASLSEANGVPFVEQVHLSVRPMRIKLVLRLQGFESTVRYRIGPEGKPLLIEQIVEISGSGMGMEGQVRTEATYSDYRAVRNER